ncbi:uncharacterized protein LOC118411067 [Branchiostoma floridae]|uniref:Claudin n=1 Tax=Branchiostoma floridae TaxID=7739 RepID=A0A9J7KRA1_BRAFL|nr:uncharacterized protein LOC118411067 [Branchiostoma floridae]
MATTAWASAGFDEYGPAVHAKNEILYVTRGLWSVCYSAFGLTECEILDPGNVALQDHVVRFFVLIGVLLAGAGLGLEAYYIRRHKMGEAVPVLVKYASGVLTLAAAVCTFIGALVYTISGPKGWNINDHIHFPGTEFDGSKWQFGYSVFLTWAAVVPLLIAGCALLYQARTLSKDVSNGAKMEIFHHTHQEMHIIESGL